jgi:hypothetical protein
MLLLDGNKCISSTPAISNEPQVEPEYFLPFTSVGLARSFRKSTFNLPDGANVYIIVQALNGAGLGTVASSDSYIVDL